MKWYIAKIVFNIVTGSPVKKSQFEEQLRLVEAASAEEAFLKAKAIGISEEEILYRDGDQFTKWEFVDVADLVAVSTLKNGVEIYSQIHETEESREYINNVHRRGMALRLNSDQPE